MRGGSFYVDASFLLSSRRNGGVPPDARDLVIGLRCARTP